jgi:predicted Zn-dependent protease
LVATLLVVALGDVTKALVEHAAAAAASFDLDVVQGAPLAEPRYAFNPQRGQHHAAAILRKLAQSQVRPGRDVVLGLGNIDLFEPEVPFLLADGDRDLRAAVVGVMRLREGVDDERLGRRVRALAVWAVGHAVGLGDCDDGRCAMSEVESVEQLDRRSLTLCPDCRGLLNEGR